jgi:FKBP-type peptidyl-prolyl cis-trans isomerase
MKAILLLVITAVACSTTAIAQEAHEHGVYKTLEHGTRFRIHPFSTGQSPHWNDFIRMSLEKYGPDGQLIFSTAMLDAPHGIEMELRDQVWPGDVTEVFLHMHPGDSAVVEVPVWVADKDSSLMHTGMEYRYHIVLHDFTPRSAFEQQRAERLEQLRNVEERLFQTQVDGYHGKKILRDSSGLILIWLKERSDQPLCEPGKPITVHYVLYLMPGGEMLDNSYQRGQTFSFTPGKGEVIKGWDLALPYLRQGEKAVLLIPSWLAYGERGAGKDIPADTPLYFEVEVVKCYFSGD